MLSKMKAVAVAALVVLCMTAAALEPDAGMESAGEAGGLPQDNTAFVPQIPQDPPGPGAESTKDPAVLKPQAIEGVPLPPHAGGAAAAASPVPPPQASAGGVPEASTSAVAAAAATQTSHAPVHPAAGGDNQQVQARPALHRKGTPPAPPSAAFAPGDAEAYDLSADDAAEGRGGLLEHGHKVKGRIHSEAWVPNRVLTAVVPAGGSLEFLEDVPPSEEGSTVRGDFIVLRGTQLAVDFEIIDPEQMLLFEDAGQPSGTFKFFAKAGQYVIHFSNPDQWSALHVSLAYLRGVDNDDPLWEASQQAGTDVMTKRISSLHAKLDDCLGEQAYYAKRFSANLATQTSNRQRVAVYTLVEAVVMFAVMFAQVTYLRKLEYTPPSWSAGGGLRRGQVRAMV